MLTNIFILHFEIDLLSHNIFSIADSVCETEFATDMPFKVVTSIFNFYIPTTCMVFLYVQIFLAIKRRTKDIEQFGAYTATGGTSARPAERKPKLIVTTPTGSAPTGACGIRSARELPMTNFAEGMQRAIARCSIRRMKRNNSSW